MKKEEGKETKAPSKGRGRRKPRSKTASPKNEVVTFKSGVDYVRSRVPDNMGITTPGFLKYSAADEDAFVPLGLVYGYYYPVGQNSNEYYPQQANQFLNRVQVSLRDRGFRTTYTEVELRTYYNSIAKLVQMQRYVAQMNGLLKVTGMASSPVLSLVASNSLNGRLLNVHRMLTRTLQSVPFPKNWVDIYMGSFGSTTLSDNPNSGLRMFAPKAFEPAMGVAIDPNALADVIEAEVTAFFAVQANRELVTSLDKSHGLIGELSLLEENLIVFREDVVNNLLNIPYYDGTTNDPVANDVTLVPMFFRRSLKPTGCLTFAPDNAIVTSPQGTVWVQNQGAESTITLVAFDNNGLPLNAYTDQNVFSCFGTMWEASAGLNAGNSPSITRVTATFQGVADGVCEVMLSNTGIN